MKRGARGVPVVDAQQAARWDEAARNRGIPSRVLMESAGRGAALVIAREFAHRLAGGVIVATGHGNNGGDGWVVARALAAAGVTVHVADTGKSPSEDCRANRDLALQDGVPALTPDETWPRVGLAVDALLGTGASGQPRGVVGELLDRLVGLDVPVAAIDGPTGLDLTSGEAHGPLAAELTVTFGGYRRGHLLARERCGRVVVLDIGFGPPPEDDAWPEVVDDAFVAATLPPFLPAMHKGDRGRVLVVGGQPGMAGAIVHAARAALAVGAGLVKVAVHDESVAAVQAALPDAMAIGCSLSEAPDDTVREALEWADAIAVGPGLGRAAGRTTFLRGVLNGWSGPAVVDADALHHDVSLLAMGTGDRVLTPHPGEFVAAFPDGPDPRTCRFAAPHHAVSQLAAAAGPGLVPTVLLKGVPTVVADASGTSWVVASGNPGLATGGSGDVLTGAIAALLAGGVAGPNAAATAAHVMGRAAEAAAEAVGVRSMRPEDVTLAIPDALAAAVEHERPLAPVLAFLEPPALS